MVEPASTQDELFAPAASWVPLTQLRSWDQNPRKNDENAIRVADSIVRFGFGAPIVARRENGEIIAGHTRLKASVLLRERWRETPELERAGWHPEAQSVAKSAIVPVRFLDIDEKDAHLLALADNRLNELSPWDDEALKRILPEYSIDDVGLAGWSPEEVAAMLDDEQDAVVEEIDTSMLRDEFWLSIRGPVPAQPVVLEKLRAVLAQIEGVEVALGLTKAGDKQ